MHSMKHISIAQCAVNVCNDRHLKREILCASGSVFDLRTKNSEKYSRKEAWNGIVQKKATEILKLMKCSKPWKKEVMKLAIPIGMRMLTWAVYHERTIGFTRDFSIDALEPSLFTQEGLVDKRRTAEKLLEEERLNNRQKYMLACLYCLEDSVKDLYRKMTTEERENSQFDPLGLTRFWNYHSRGESYPSLRGKRMNIYVLGQAVESGSKAAVEFCWNIIERSEESLKDEALQYAAIHAVRCSLTYGMWDWNVFRDSRYLCDVWVPSAYYIEILCFVLSKMTEDQKREFLEEDTKTDYREVPPLPNVSIKRSRVLEYFLIWPYQDRFMETARLMWKFLPENNYATLLLNICDKICSRWRTHLQNGEEKHFDYRVLLEEFWMESPERFKRYIFSNERVTYMADELISLKAGTGLLTSLLTLQSFSDGDKEAIRLILAEATVTEKQNIISDGELARTCVNLAKQEKLVQLSALSPCFTCMEEENNFKREFIRDWRGQSVFIASVQSNKWNAFLSFVKWCAVPEEQLKELKKELMNSAKVQDAIKYLLVKKQEMALADIVLMWCFSSEREIKIYKKDFVFLNTTIEDYEYIFSQEEANLIDKFVKWCLSSQDEIEELKKKVLNDMGVAICLHLIYSSYRERSKKIEGGEWKKFDNFLKWCLLTEERMYAFKRKTILEELGARILSDLIISNEFEKAENFVACLHFPTEDIKILKQKTFQIYVNYKMCRAETCNNIDIAIRNALSDDQQSGMIYNGEIEWEKNETEQFFKFCLTEREEVIRFKNGLKAYASQDINKFRKYVAKELCLMLDERLRDIDAKEGEVQRKFETLSL